MTAMTRRPGSSVYGAEVAFAALVLSLVVSAWFARFVNQNLLRHEQDTFLRQSAAVTARFDRQMQVSLGALQGVAGLFAASQEVSRDEFAAYAEHLNLASRLPGMASIAYIAVVPEAERAAFIAQVRGDASVQPGGHPEFAIFPGPPRGVSYVLTFVEPRAANASAMGFDIASDPVRLRALEQALRDRAPVASDFLRLVQSATASADAFVIYVPLFRAANQAGRPEAHVGFVSGAFRVTELLQSVLEGTEEQQFTLSLERDDGQMPPSTEDARIMRVDGALITSHQIEVAGQPWRLVFRASEDYGLTDLERVLPAATLALGIIISLLLFGTLASLALSRLRAVKLAGNMTEELRRQRDSLLVLDRAVASTADGIIITNPNAPDNPIVYCNAGFERLTGYARDEVLGRNCRFLSAPDHAQPAIAEMRAATKAQRSCRVVLRNFKKDGSMFWSEVTISPVFDAQGHLLNFIGVQHDMTRLKELQEKEILQAQTLAHGVAELQQQQKVMRSLLEDLQSSKSRLEAKEQSLQSVNKRLQDMAALKDEFVAKVSHELRTPLTSIKEGMSLMLDNALGETTPDQREFLRTMDGDLDRLAELINNMLDLSKIEAGRMRLTRVRLPARELAESVVRSHQPLLGSRRIEIREEASRAGIVFADRHRLVQVLTNLFSNALKFTPEDGRITMRLGGRDGKVTIAVEDTGPGISAHDLAKLFQKFSQVGARDPSKPRGTGLGLAVAKELTELHSGHIDVASEVGRGTTFTIVLPEYSDDLALMESVRELSGAAHVEEGEEVALIAVQAADYLRAGAGPGREDALQALAETIRRHVHRGDIVLPVHGTWVAVLAVTDRPGVTVITKRIREAISNSERLHVGAAMHPTDAPDAAALFRVAAAQLDQGPTGTNALAACRTEQSENTGSRA